MLVVYVSNDKVDVAPFPRYHLRQHTFNRMRIRARKIRLLDDHKTKLRCGYSPYGKGNHQFAVIRHLSYNLPNR